MNFLEDNTKLQLSIDGTFTATELETLITKLAIARSKLKPAISNEPPTLETKEEDLPTYAHQTDPTFAIGKTTDGSINMWLRHEGLGWLIFTLPIDKAFILRDWLTNSTKEESLKFLAHNLHNGGLYQ